MRVYAPAPTTTNRPFVCMYATRHTHIAYAIDAMEMAISYK